MTNHYDVCDRWVNVVTGRSKRSLKCGNVFFLGDTIYSYGTHFALAEAIRNKKGELALFLLNGDRFSVTTNRHQSTIRSAVAREDVPSLIVPFSALDVAGIERRTVELVDVSSDRTEPIHHRTYTQPEGSQWRDVPITEYRRKSDEAIQALLDAKNDELMRSWETKHRLAAEEQTDPRGYAHNGLRPHFWSKWLEEQSVQEYPYEATEDDLSHHRMHHDVVVDVEHRLYQSHHKYAQQITVTDTGDGRRLYEWTTYRHWLGESLLRAEIEYAGYTICKACRRDGQSTGARAEAPPRPNRADYSYSYEFQDAVWAWRERWRCPDCAGNGGRHWTRRRRAYFLSGFDQNERRPSYFFCELPPKARPTTIEEAYEALKPDTVKLAEQMGRHIRRQGDIFAVPLSNVTKRDLTKKGARYEKRGQLLGTNHVATEVAYLPDGATLVRGTLVHAPWGRRPDHARVPVGKHWHVVLKNTVPISS